MTHFQAVPETGDAIVILTNSQRSWPFIAYLLSDWARWRSFPGVGMGRIIWGHYGLSAAIGMLLSASLLLALRAILPFYRKKRRGCRVFRICLAALILVVLLCCACREYLLISSVFPGLSTWLGGAAFVLALALLMPAFIRCKSDF